jgi:hypothetical protein
LTPEKADMLTSMVKMGNTLKASAYAAGIGERTFLRWLQRGARASRGRYRQLFERIRAARGVAEAAAVGELRKLISAGDFRAIAFFLERSNPAEWGAKTRVDVEQLEPVASPTPVSEGDRKLLLTELVTWARSVNRQRALAAQREGT